MSIVCDTSSSKFMTKPVIRLETYRTKGFAMVALFVNILRSAKGLRTHRSS